MQQPALQLRLRRLRMAQLTLTLTLQPLQTLTPPMLQLLILQRWRRARLLPLAGAGVGRARSL